MPVAMKPPPWKCATCRERDVWPITLDYQTEIEHDGRPYAIDLPGLPVKRCGHCGTIVPNDEADEKIYDALRRAAGLLHPNQIRQYRESFGMTQRELARFLQVAESTLSRWETGAQIQQRAMDKLLRGFFEVPEFRRFLQRHDSTSVNAATSGSAAELRI